MAPLFITSLSAKIGEKVGKSSHMFNFSSYISSEPIFYQVVIFFQEILLIERNINCLIFYMNSFQDISIGLISESITKYRHIGSSKTGSSPSPYHCHISL